MNTLRGLNRGFVDLDAEGANSAMREWLVGYSDKLASTGNLAYKLTKAKDII